jgi:hypothetical protein
MAKISGQPVGCCSISYSQVFIGLSDGNGLIYSVENNFEINVNSYNNFIYS